MTTTTERRAPGGEEGAQPDHQYRKKPIVVEAFQMTRERRTRNCDWPEWLHEAWRKDRYTVGAAWPTDRGTDRIVLGTLEGEHLVDWDNWIIRGIQGELYSCKPDIFADTYEKVGEETAQPIPGDYWNGPFDEGPEEAYQRGRKEERERIAKLAEEWAGGSYAHTKYYFRRFAADLRKGTT